MRYKFNSNNEGDTLNEQETYPEITLTDECEPTCYSPIWKGPRKFIYKIPFGPYKKFLIQLGISLLIFVFFIGLTKTEESFSKKVRTNVRYLLTKETDFRPFLQKAIKLGLQVQDVDWSLFAGMDDNVLEVMSRDKSKLLMAVPVSGKILKPYGWVKDKDGLERYHEGLDIEAPLGTPVKAALGGIVLKTGEDKLLGKYILIDHGNRLTTLYGNLGEVLVKKKDKVKTGQVIGKVGSSGIVDQPQLHFEVRDKNEFVDPIEKLDIKK